MIKVENSFFIVLIKILIVILALIVTIFLLNQISSTDFKNILLKLSFFEITLLIIMYFIPLVFRGIRLYYITGSEEKILKLICISPIHSLFNHILPFRLGEITLPFMFKAFTNKGFISGGVSILILRLYDLITVSTIFILSFSVYFWRKLSNMIYYIVIVIILLLIITIAYFIIAYLSEVLLMIGKFLSSWAIRFGKRGRIYGDKIFGITEEITDQIKKLSRNEKKIILPLISFIIWTSIYTFFYFLMLFMDIKIHYSKSILASSGAIITNILPINGLGSFGTLEGGWSLGYTIVGISKNFSISSGFIMHIIVIATLFFSSLVGIFYLLMNKKIEKRAYSEN